MDERRRRFITAAGIALFPAISGCSGQSDSEEDEPNSSPENGATTTGSATETLTGPTTASNAVEFTIENVSARAWEVTEDGSDSVAPLNTENPTLSFEVGQRYTVENRGWSAHPFAIRDGDDSPLLSQSADGQFGDDDAVDWTDDGETFTFTYTEDLAAAADYYVCTVHSGMRGGVETA